MGVRVRKPAYSKIKNKIFLFFSPEGIATSKKESYKIKGRLHHAYTFTVGTYPGRPITDAPFVLFKAVFTDHKATGAAPTEILFSFTAVANILTYFSSPVSWLFLLRCHGCTSPYTQCAYSSLELSISCTITSGRS